MPCKQAQPHTPPSLRGAVATRQSIFAGLALRASGLLRTSCGASRRPLARNDAHTLIPSRRRQAERLAGLDPDRQFALIKRVAFLEAERRLQHEGGENFLHLRIAVR